MREKYIKNSIILFICLIFTKFFGAIYKILLSNILGTRGIGIYQMIFFVYSLFLVFITGAMPTFISQRVSKFRASNDFASIASLVKNALMLCTILGLIFSTVLTLMAQSFAIWQGNSDAYWGYVIVGVSIIFSAVACVIKGYFLGIEHMSINAICGIVEQIVKLCIGLIMARIFAKNGVIFAIYGAFLGVLFSEIVAFIFMIIFYMCKKQKVSARYSLLEIKNTFWGFLPLVFSNLVLPLSNFVDSFLVVNLLMTKFSKTVSTSLFGIATGMIAPLVNFPVLLCGTICTAILPTISYSFAQKKDVSGVFGGALSFVFMLFVPCAFGMLALSRNIVVTFFPSIEIQFMDIASFYLQVMSFNIIWLSLFQIISSLLVGIGEFRLPLIAQTIGVVVKISVTVILILFTKLNILSLAIAINVGNILTICLSIGYMRKYVCVNMFKQKFILSFACALIMFFIVLGLDMTIKLNAIIKIGMLITLGALVYFSLCIILKVFSIKSVKNMFFKSKMHKEKLK